VTTRVFVYGTLKPGHLRWPILQPFAERGEGDWSGWAHGRLFDTGYGWPAAVFESTVGDPVPGVVVAISPRSISQALAALDAVEGVADGLFRRVLVNVSGQSCWAYHWPGSTIGFNRIACRPVPSNGLVELCDPDRSQPSHS
jgi:gamma-glutamylcyclotransferase (GGCT)/AIG2-like uncharacterized protein YtfP